MGMRALVLCGGIPQIALLKELKSRGFTTILADMNEKVGARIYADKFYPISTLDVNGIKHIAIQEKVEFVITVCADQVLEVVAQVSEELNLPCYIDLKTAVNVSNKSMMKSILMKNGIPTSKYIIAAKLEEVDLSGLNYPLIVKPVDSYSSRGVRKVFSFNELKNAFADAIRISRTNTAIVEEFAEGNELTVDVYIEDGKAHTLCISSLDKIGDGDRFVIYRTRYPADISDLVRWQIENIAQKIADSFGLENSPMLIQLITNGEKISVIEFCARTGGGDKFRLIKKATAFDVVKAVVDLTLGEKPHVKKNHIQQKFIVNEFLYCSEGDLDHLEGFEEALDLGIITEYYQLKQPGAEMGTISSSGDRVAYFTVEDFDYSNLIKRHRMANNILKVITSDGKDMLRHDLIASFEMGEE